MALAFFIKGMTIGFLIAAPVGPIGVLCIRRSLAEGVRAGLATGMGAATADAAYGCVAGFGLTAVSDFLVSWRLPLGLFGGVFICYLGIRTFVSHPAEETANAAGGRLLTAYLSTVALTLANPMTILSFAAVFLGLGVGAAPGYGKACALVLGVFTGSALWWIILSCGVGRLRSRLGPGWTRSINRLSGAVLVIFGVCATTRVLFR
jgi:threonine/homoserine/homoserine lactone efflux protein